MHIDEFRASRLFHMAQESILEHRMDVDQLRFVSKFLNIKFRFNILTLSSLSRILIQLIFYSACLLTQPQIANSFVRVWPIVLFLFASVVLVFATTEICKWEELK